MQERAGRAIARCAALAATLAACGGEEPAAPPALGEPRCTELRLEALPAGASAVIVLNDAMRRDYVGTYAARARTPHLERLAEEGLVFEHAVSQSPWTKPSIATLFTGLYPSQHAVASHPSLRRDSEESEVLEVDLLSDGFVTLAEALRAAGLRTAAFVANPWLAQGFGFEQGFELYDDSFADWSAEGESAARAALTWIEGLAPGEPFFLYLHLIESHRPYGRLGGDLDDLRERLNGDERPTGVDAEALAAAIQLEDGTPSSEAGFRPTRALFHAAYARGVESFDAILGSFLDGLRASGAWERTAVIVTSDHGEALYLRGYGNHGQGFFQDETALPLVARLPGVSPERGRVECLVGLVDLMPSLCDYLGAECPSAASGWSFVAGAEVTTGQDRRFLVTEGVMGRPSHRAIRDRSFKLLYEPEGKRGGRASGSPWSLYDMEEDPRERFDRADPRLASARTRGALDRMRRALPDAVSPYAAPAAATAPVSPELQRRLESLGYLGDVPAKLPNSPRQP